MIKNTRGHLPAAAANELTDPSPGKLPRWHEFKLLNKFNGCNDHPITLIEACGICVAMGVFTFG